MLTFVQTIRENSVPRNWRTNLWKAASHVPYLGAIRSERRLGKLKQLECVEVGSLYHPGTDSFVYQISYIVA